MDIALSREFLGFGGELSKTQISDRLRRSACSFVREKMRRIFSPNPDSPAYRGKAHLEKPHDGRSPGGGGASGGMDARVLVKAAEKEIGIERP